MVLISLFVHCFLYFYICYVVNDFKILSDIGDIHANFDLNSHELLIWTSYTLNLRYFFFKVNVCGRQKHKMLSWRQLEDTSWEILSICDICRPKE